MPRSQIDSARLDSAKGLINVTGPLVLDPGVTAATLCIHVTLIQGGAYAAGTATETRAGAGQGRWIAQAETVGAFDVDEDVQAFGIVVTAERDPADGRRVHQTFTWSERMRLEVQL